MLTEEEYKERQARWLTETVLGNYKLVPVPIGKPVANLLPGYVDWMILHGEIVMIIKVQK